MKKPEVFVPPEGTRALGPDKEERERYGARARARNPLLTKEDAVRLLKELRNVRRGGAK